jgi:hypothetical protein
MRNLPPLAFAVREGVVVAASPRKTWQNPPLVFAVREGLVVAMLPRET